MGAGEAMLRGNLEDIEVWESVNRWIDEALNQAIDIQYRANFPLGTYRCSQFSLSECLRLNPKLIERAR